MSARRSSWKSRGRTALPRQAARVWRLALAQGCSWQRRWSPWEVMKATQTQATSPKVNSPFQRCPEGKWRSRTSATFRRRKVANRMGMSSTRSTRCTCGDVLSMHPLLVPDAYFETPSFLSRTGGDNGEVEVEVPMEAATLRELLHKLNAKVWLWFVPRRDGKKGWEIDRGRFKAEVGNQVYYDGPSTLGKSHSTANRLRTSGG